MIIKKNVVSAKKALSGKLWIKYNPKTRKAMQIYTNGLYALRKKADIIEVIQGYPELDYTKAQTVNFDVHMGQLKRGILTRVTKCPKNMQKIVLTRKLLIELLGYFDDDFVTIESDFTNNSTPLYLGDSKNKAVMVKCRAKTK